MKTILLLISQTQTMEHFHSTFTPHYSLLCEGDREKALSLLGDHRREIAAILVDVQLA